MTIMPPTAESDSWLLAIAGASNGQNDAVSMTPLAKSGMASSAVSDRIT